MHSLRFWEKEKRKLLKHRRHCAKKQQLKHSYQIYLFMPDWQRRIRKRLEQVQILLDEFHFYNKITMR